LAYEAFGIETGDPISGHRKCRAGLGLTRWLAGRDTYRWPKQMASDDHSGARPAGPVVLRIKLRYDDVDALVQRFAPNVGKSGLFLPTKSIQPIGT
jgi:hypothetical protein